MGNAGCACMSSNSIKAVQGSKKATLLSYNHSPLMIILDKKEDGFEFLQKIDFHFCFTHSFGPFFLDKDEEIFGNSFKEKSNQLRLQLISLTNLDKYIADPSSFPLIAEYEGLYKSNSLDVIKSIPFEQLKAQLFYCNSALFRLPLYLSILSASPLLNYSRKHKSQHEPNDKLKAQIELDLPRTFPLISGFNEEAFRLSFRNLLCEIALRDNSIGYVQGMNFIAGFCLMLSGNQTEIALVFFTKLFSMKSKLCNLPLREMYSRDFPLLFKYVEQFRELMRRHEKELYDKVVQMKINDHLWVSKWILTLCLTSFDNEVVLKCWDILIAKGIDYILVICLTVASYYKKQLLAAERLDQFMEVVGQEIKLDKEHQRFLLSQIISNVENDTYSF